MNKSNLKSKSMRSIRNLSEKVRIDENVEQLGRLNDNSDEFDLDIYLPLACSKLECVEEIAVVREYQKDDYLSTLKQKQTSKKNVKINPVDVLNQDIIIINSDDDVKNEKKSIFSLFSNSNAVIVKTIYDDNERLVAISFNKAPFIPKILMQLITFVSPQFRKLAKISFTNSRINAFTIHELRKLLPLCNITDICLDNSPLPEANYAILFDETSNLRNLSLAGCNIDDHVCERIALKLTSDNSTETKLSLLNLSYNHITDAGATTFGAILRRNRYLQYLNLSGNRISDSGAGCIFDSLNEFKLTDDEISVKRERYVNYLKEKQGIYFRILNEMEAESIDDSVLSQKKTKGRKTSATFIKKKNKRDSSVRNLIDETEKRASVYANEILGPFDDPFGPLYTYNRDDITYCVGNSTLAYLNLAYNNLTYLILNTIQSVLMHQTLTKKPNQTGLLKLVLDGNYLPYQCKELETISDLLTKSVNLRSAQREYGGRRKSITKTPRL